MFTLKSTQGIATKQTADVLLILHPQGVSLASNSVLMSADEALAGGLMTLLKQDNFSGKSGESVAFPTLSNLPVRKVIVVGLGEKTTLERDGFRKLGAQLIKRLKQLKIKTAAIAWPEVTVSGESLQGTAEALAEGMWLGAYTFHAFKGRIHEAQTKDKQDIEEIVIIDKQKSVANMIQRGIEEAAIFADGTLLARTLVNTPPNHMLPSDLVGVAEKVASEGKRVSLTVLDEQKMKALGMNAALAVAQGSYNGAKGAHLVYHPKGKAKKRIILVGKAVTFDSGGLSIKPADGMMTMKCDMAGAAAVIGVFQALTKLDLNIEVHGIFLAVENMPSGNAYRPGDVVKAMDGTTIEVLNTDAEGRVTLADALSYANTLKPDVIIDLATLTGACVVALGDDISAIMTQDKKLRDGLLDASKEAGEYLWPLPLHEPYQELIKSKVADIKNIGGGRAGGAITAGLFLQHFVGKTPWAHLDIAGPAYIEKETRPDMPVGGTGYGVRTLLRYLQGI